MGALLNSVSDVALVVKICDMCWLWACSFSLASTIKFVVLAVRLAPVARVGKLELDAPPLFSSTATSSLSSSSSPVLLL